MIKEELTGMRAGWIEMRNWFSEGQVWAAVAFMLVLLTVTGAFDTYLIKSMADRALLFGVVTGLGSVLCVVATGVLRAVTGISAYNSFKVSILVGFASILPGAIVGRIMQSSFTGQEWTWLLVARSCVHGVFLVSVILAMMYMARFHALNRVDKPQERAVPNGPTLLPSYMASEDHYLKIVRESGVELIRANISDFAQRFGADGLRCHKSYWVSRDAIEKRHRQGRQLWLVLKDGTQIPVGRSYEKEVRAALG